MRTLRRTWATIAALVVAAATASSVIAQRGGARGSGAMLGTDPVVRNLPYDGRFTFVRLRYTGYSGNYYYRGIPSWAHGHNSAERNLLSIVSEISILRPHRSATNVLSIDDPELFRFPVAFMTEAGYWAMTDREAEALRAYLLKGGFLILDDSREGMSPGNAGWANIERNFQRILPDKRFVDLSIAHPIFHSFFDIRSFDIVRQYYDRGPPVFRALFENNDPNGRIMVLVNFNTDVSNYWEFSATGFRPVDESNEAYELGVNYLIYALTH